MKHFATYVSMLAITLLMFTSAMAQGCNEKIEYNVKQRNDGGYDLLITCVVRSFRPLTAEGFFPKKTSHYRISIVGEGKDLSYRNLNGFYYSLNEISTNKTSWDLGYIWVDKERKNIYLNLYWLSPPSDLKPSEVHGKYQLKPHEKKQGS